MQPRTKPLTVRDARRVHRTVIVGAEDFGIARRGLEAHRVQKKYYWLALIPLGGVWIYGVGQSAGELFGLLPEAPAQRAVTVEAPSEPLRPPLASGGGDSAVVESTTVSGRQPPAPVARPVAPPVTAPAPLAYADAEPVTDGAEPVDHPEVTDPHLRKLLRPAWED
jgi:hypothetical protein